jgi:hypothetical protein
VTVARDAEGSEDLVRASALAEIHAVLVRQQEAWNRGDLNSLLQTYWKSDEVRYASEAEVVRGFAGICERFHTAYPDRTAMGRLRFSDLETRLPTASDALVFGRFTIARGTGRLEGLFSIHLKRFAEGWLIASDHTSSAPEFG